MFQIFENGKLVSKMQTREELFRYFIRRDLNVYVCTADQIMSYTPSAFQLLAMNPNDQYAPGALYGNFLSFSQLPLYPRPIMILEDGRLVDIRPWLPEIRDYLIRWKAQIEKHVCGLSFSTGHKPKFRHMYRRPKGYKQSQQGLSPADAEEILEVMATIPDKLRKVNHMDDSCCWKQHSRSWKENSKARKSWQKLKRQKAPASQCLRMLDTIWDELDLEEDDNTVA